MVKVSGCRDKVVCRLCISDGCRGRGGGVQNVKGWVVWVMWGTSQGLLVWALGVWTRFGFGKQCV